MVPMRAPTAAVPWMNPRIGFCMRPSVIRSMPGQDMVDRRQSWGIGRYREHPGRQYHDSPDMALGLLYRLYEHNLLAGLDRNRLPSHIGVVLDGHRRHARAEGLPSYSDSYRVGMERFEEFLGWADDLKIPAVTAW